MNGLSFRWDWPAITGFLEILFLTAGILAGSFTLERVFDFPEHIPPVFFEVRTLCLIAFAAIWGFRRMRGLEKGKITMPEHCTPVSLAMMGILLVYMLIANAAIWEQPAGPSAFYPLVFVLLYSMAALLCIDSLQKIRLLAKTAIGLILTIDFLTFWHSGFAITSLNTMPLGSPFFFSRSSLIGFCFSLFLFCDQHKRFGFVRQSLIYIIFAVLFLYVGLLTYQRSTMFFYGMVGIITFMLLITRRDYFIASILAICLVSGYLIAFSTLGSSLTSRLVYHLPTHVSANENGRFIEGEESRVVKCPKTMTLANNSLCGFDREKIDQCMEYLKNIIPDQKIKNHITRETCRSAVVINDSDARIRLMHQAMNTSEKFVGNGLDTFFFVQYDDREKKTYVYYYPHSIFFGIYHDTGLIGLSLLIIAVLAMLVLGLRVVIAGPISSIILLIIPIYYLLASFVSGDIYDARFLWFIPIMIRNCMLPDFHKRIAGVEK